MTDLRKKLLIGITIWFLISVVVPMFDPIPVFIHRQDFDKAAAAFQQDPTPKNEAVLRTEQKKNQSIRHELRFFEAATLFFGGILCYGVYSGVRFILSSRKQSCEQHGRR